MLVRDLIDAMQRIAPLEYAESWDRVGLLVGKAERELDGPVLLTIDLTERVMREAKDAGARAIIAYHPVIWDPVARVTDETARGRILLGAIEAGLCIYTPHTALDAAPGGVTDWLCEGLSGSGQAGKIAGDCRALQPTVRGGGMCKIVTFLPLEAMERVRGALATAGAGRIGAYSLCSFSTEGTGTFLGGAGTKPVSGVAGRVEHVPERRLEMVCPKANLALALETMRQFHPYEEPAIDVYEMSGEPLRRAGAGRRLVLDRPATLMELADRLKRFLPRYRLRAALVAEDRPMQSLGVVPGAGEGLAPLAAREGCELFFTGEMRHHQILDCLHQDMSVLLAGHANTERGYLPRLAERLRAMLPGLEASPAKADTDLLFVL
ncbi:MAG: Nif3-like dinuclear metal center hexameric protein [Phycisphaerales bacterium]|nr:Nif3-like dinuclear metal center hexameric protein [Phycisphaerales bacterium]